MLLTSSDGAVAKLDGDVYRQCRLWAITRVDGWKRYFTDHNEIVPFMGTDFKPMNGISASASRRETSFKGQNFEALGVISDTDITIEDLATDKFLNATIQEWIVDWMYPFHGYFLYSTFTIRDHDHDGATWKAQVEGPISKLEQTIGETYSTSCRRHYGEKGCNRALTNSSDPSINYAIFDANGVSMGTAAANGHPQLILNKFNQPLGPNPFKPRWMQVINVRVATPPVGEENTEHSFYLNAADIPPAYSEPNSTAISNHNVTMAVGSPGVVTAVGHGLATDTPVIFNTNGSLLIGITASITYFWISTGTDTGNIAAVPGGTAINFSGTQSGTHTMVAGEVDYWDFQTRGGWFSKGRLGFTTGVLATPNNRYEILFYDHPYGATTRRVQMRLPLSSVPQVDDELVLWAGCEKTWDHCRGKNANVYFFGGFIFIPGPDQIYGRPGSA